MIRQINFTPCFWKKGGAALLPKKFQLVRIISSFRMEVSYANRSKFSA